MADFQAYCDEKQEQLHVLQGQFGGVRDKIAQAVPSADIEKLVAQWQQAESAANLRLTELRQQGSEDLASLRPGTDQMWAELSSLVASLKSAF